MAALPGGSLQGRRIWACCRRWVGLPCVGNKYRRGTKAWNRCAGLRCVRLRTGSSSAPERAAPLSSGRSAAFCCPPPESGGRCGMGTPRRVSACRRCTGVSPDPRRVSVRPSSGLGCWRRAPEAVAFGVPEYTLCCSYAALLKKLLPETESSYCVRGRQKNSCKRTPAAGAGFRLCVLQLRQRNSELYVKCFRSLCSWQLFRIVNSSPRCSDLGSPVFFSAL